MTCYHAITLHRKIHEGCCSFEVVLATLICSHQFIIIMLTWYFCVVAPWQGNYLIVLDGIADFGICKISWYVSIWCFAVYINKINKICIHKVASYHNIVKTVL